MMSRSSILALVVTLLLVGAACEKQVEEARAPQSPSSIAHPAEDPRI